MLNNENAPIERDLIVTAEHVSGKYLLYRVFQEE
jgi:hypothetical protein